jgi:RHS repeat-associated protein
VRAESITAMMVYTYNAAGLRVAQSVDGDVTTFVWDWASGVPEMLSEGQAMGSSVALYLVGHETLGRWDGADWTYYLPDALGSIRQEADGTGAVTDSREWTPFGVEVGTAQEGLGYAGEWWDVHVGLLYLRARWYDELTGRFTRVDPLRLEQNLYLYADANPVNWTDPSGWYHALVVQGANPEGLAVRSSPQYMPDRGPMFGTNLLRRLPDGTRVIVHPDFPSPGTDDNSNRRWYHLFSINGEFVWNVFGPWAASDYLVDESGPPGPEPSPSTDWVLPLDESITYWNGYGYYDWAVQTDGTCSPCESYQRPELEHPAYGCKLCFHNGWDMTSASTNVYAMGDGVVKTTSGVNRLDISHVTNDVEIEVQYTHIQYDQGSLGNGATVQSGQLLGNWGAYGTAFPHFHWTVKVGGQVVNPKDYWPGNVPISFTGSWGNPICIPPDCP